MPKDFDKSKLGFSAGKKGSTQSDYVIYKIDGTTITGNYYGILGIGEGITIRCELPEGYFVGAGIPISKYISLMFIVPVLFALISLFLWFKYGRDDQVIETVEFYPPEGFNSLEVGFLYKGKAENNDVTSLLIYLANKGYIKITETEKKSLFSKTQDFKITKLKEYDGENKNEEIFLNGLFKKRKITLNSLLKQEDEFSEDLDEVTSTDLEDNFYITKNKILSNINNKENKNKIFEKSTTGKSIIVILMIIISLFTVVTIPTIDVAGLGELVMTLAICLFYMPFYAVGIFSKMPILFKVFWLGFTIFHSLIFFYTLPITYAITNEYMYLLGVIVGAVCLIIMGISVKLMSKRTPYGNEILGKLKGFKNFLENAEKEKLEMMVMENPTYFYDILPYTYVLGVSDKWIKKFETISLQAPDWYDSSTGFNMATFGTFMTSTMASASSSMSSSPSSGDSSGGGSSGGGSGGGGGGSW